MVLRPSANTVGTYRQQTDFLITSQAAPPVLLMSLRVFFMSQFQLRLLQISIRTIFNQRLYKNNMRSPYCRLFKYALLVILLVLISLLDQKVSKLIQQKHQMKLHSTQFIEAVYILEKQLQSIQVSKNSLFDNSTSFQQERQSIIKILNVIDMQIEFEERKKVQSSSNTGQPTIKQQIQRFNKTITKIEDQVINRKVFLNFLMAYSKQYVRGKKMEMLQNVARTRDFQQEKVRNPFALARNNLHTPFLDALQKRLIKQQLLKQSYRLEKNYSLSAYKQLSLCIVVPTYNNAKNYRYEFNLQSILNQDYERYHVVIIDDASTDLTSEIIKLFLKKNHKWSQKVQLIINKQRKKALANIEEAVKIYCKKDQIGVIVSGDDELLGNMVFKLINSEYKSKGVGAAYTNHFYGKLHKNDYEKGYSRSYQMQQMKKLNYRFVSQKFGHLRTFRVDLFQKIKSKDFKDFSGKYFETTWDEAIMLPIMEMSCEKVDYIDEYTYLYNMGTGQNDGQIRGQLQNKISLFVRQRPRYKCLKAYQSLA